MKKLILITICLFLTACSSFTKQETRYIYSAPVPPLRLTPEISSGAVGDDYIIPPIQQNAISHAVSITPPDSLADKIARGEVPKSALKQKIKPTLASENKSTANPDDMGAQVVPATNNAGTQVLQLPKTKAQVWPQVAQVLPKLNYPVLNQNQTTGIFYILDKSATDGRVTKQTPIIQLHFYDVANGSRVFVTDNNGNYLDPTVAQTILTNLNNGLNGDIPSPITRWLKEVF